MNLEIMTLCDAATDSQGKLNILGTFDSIWARQEPIVHPQCAIALRLRFDRGEEGEHRIRINVVDADGRAIMPGMDAKMNVAFGADQDAIVTNVILNIHQLKIEKFGHYAIDLIVDGRPTASLPLFVRPVPAQA